METVNSEPWVVVHGDIDRQSGRSGLPRARDGAIDASEVLARVTLDPKKEDEEIWKLQTWWRERGP